MPPETDLSSEKRIFKFFDGFSDVYDDPFEIDYRFQKASEFEDMKLIDSWIAQLPKDEEGYISKNADDSQIKLYEEGAHRYVPIIQKAFLVKPFDRSTGEGLTGNQVLDLYGEYLIWKHDLKKNTE